MQGKTEEAKQKNIRKTRRQSWDNKENKKNMQKMMKDLYHANFDDLQKMGVVLRNKKIWNHSCITREYIYTLKNKIVLKERIESFFFHYVEQK